MPRRWQLGRVWVVRHAGFPFDWIEELGVPEDVLAAAARVLDAERALLSHFVGKPQKHKAAVEAITTGRLPSTLKPAPGSWAEDTAALLSARATLQSAWSACQGQLKARLWERAKDEGVQEAVFLSSPAMYDNVWARYVASFDHPDNADTRRIERQAYTYLQRLCAKNETTSFFGPMAYGERTTDRAGVTVTLAPAVVRRTFFSFWAVTELTKAVNRDPELRHHLPVRRNPLFRVEGGRARCAPLGLDVALSTDHQKVLSALEDSGTLTSAAAALGLPLEQVEKASAGLLKITALLRGVQYPVDAFETFEGLQAAMRALPEVPARERWLGELKTMASKLSAFADGDLATRRKLLLVLEAEYTRLTGVAARRGEGDIYADRFVVYEEAGSRFGVKFGEAFFERLERLLSAPLELSAAYGEQVQAVHRKQMSEQLGQLDTPIDFLDYAIRTRPKEVSGSRFSPVPPVRLEETAAHEVTLSAQTWGASSDGARYALPDVCLSGSLSATSDGGNFKVLLARVHHHLLLYCWLAAFYPDRARFEGVAGRWLKGDPAGRSLIQLSIRRRNKGFYVFPGRRLVYSATEAADIGGATLAPSDVRVRNTAEGPELYDLAGERAFLYLALDDFSHYAPFAALTHPQVLHAAITTEGAHVPRVVIDEVTYQRERWKVPGEQLTRLKGVELFLQLQRLRREGGWPRFVYVRSATSRKPYLIDTQSPFALELLRHVTADGELSTFEEMLPAPEDLWLRDERGRYTCELRMQAERWSDPSRR